MRGAKEEKHIEDFKFLYSRNVRSILIWLLNLCIEVLT